MYNYKLRGYPCVCRLPRPRAAARPAPAAKTKILSYWRVPSCSAPVSASYRVSVFLGRGPLRGRARGGACR